VLVGQLLTNCTLAGMLDLVGFITQSTTLLFSVILWCPLQDVIYFVIRRKSLSHRKGTMCTFAPWRSYLILDTGCLLLQFMFCFLILLGIFMYYYLYHAIENTANQSTGKPLYIRQYYVQPSHDMLYAYVVLTVLATVFSMAWEHCITSI